MVPFRVFDPENKVMWIVLNYHPGGEAGAGSYLIAREGSGDLDGQMLMVGAERMTSFRLVDFLEEASGHYNQ